MWEPRYCPRKYVAGCKSVPVVMSRLCGPTRKDTAYRSTYGVWNDDSGLRGCGLWDDVLFQRYQRGNGGSRTATQRRNVSQPISRVTTLRQQFRFEALAAPKRYGQCGPRCKKPRCAAIEHEHKPYCAADKRKERKGEKRFGTRTSAGTVKNTYTTMPSIHVQDRIPSTENHGLGLGLRNLKKVNESGELEDLPTDEQNCERNCRECSNSAQESMEAITYNPEGTTNSSYGTELKSSTTTTTRTMGTNTEKRCDKVDYEIPVRVLKEQNNNIMEIFQKATSPIPRVKVPTPIPRVALLKPPKPKPFKYLNKLAKTMIKSELQLQTPQPEPWSISSPQSLRTTPRKESHPQTQKLAPRLFTPPTSIPFTRTNSVSPRSQSSIIQDQNLQQNQPEPTELQPTELQLKPIQPLNPPQTLNLREALNRVSNQSSRKSSQESSQEDSRGDSLVTTTSEFDSSSEGASVENSNQDSIAETPSMYCLCSLCGKSERFTDGSRMNSAAVYRNNPLYSPPQSLTRSVSSNSGSAVSWRLFYTLLEVLTLVVLGGALTLGLIPYVESVFRAYMADFCRCTGKGVGKGPELTADGMQSGVVKWVTCMLDDSRVTLTPLG